MRLGSLYFYAWRYPWKRFAPVLSFGNSRLHISAKLTRDELFSERYNHVFVIRFAGLSISIRDKRKYPNGL